MSYEIHSQLLKRKHAYVQDQLSRVLSLNFTPDQLAAVQQFMLQIYNHAYMQGVVAGKISGAELLFDEVKSSMDHLKKALGSGLGL